MWKCASNTLKATFNKSVSRCNTVLSTKVPQGKDINCLLKLTPVLLDQLNRYYGFYKNSCGNFHKGKKDREGPRQKKSSFLGRFDHDVFDALGWSGVIVIGYYLIQPFTRKRLSSYNDPYNSHPYPTLVGYQRTLQYLLNVGIKPFSCVLPEVKAAKSKKKNDRLLTESTAENLNPEPNFSSLEKAHQKVLGALNNWIGTQCMHTGKHKEALEYFKEAAEEDSPAGIFNLGICHEKGLGTNQNFNRAAELYQKAADLGHATAMYNLGVFYAQGLGGIEADVDHARELFKAAANLGQKDAKKALSLEKESSKELHDNSLNNEQKSKEKKEILISQFICDKLLHQASLSPVEYCNVFADGVKSGDCNSFGYTNEKYVNSTLDSDSGILDLSPTQEPDVLIV